MDGFKINDGGMRKLRRALWTTHRLDNDTELVLIAGDRPPQYEGGIDKGATMTVGLLWLRDNFPEAFAEAVSQRLTGNTKTFDPTA